MSRRSMVHRWLAPMLALAVVVQVCPATAVAAEPPAPGVGAAPRQESGSADGPSRAVDTDTKLVSPNRPAVRPPGAVPDRRELPKPGTSTPAYQPTRTDVKLREERPGIRWFSASSSVQKNADADDTYVTKGQTAPSGRSDSSILEVGNAGSSRVHAAYLHFSALTGSLAKQYIVGATLNMHNIESATCTDKAVDVYAVGESWSGTGLTRWPGASLGRHLRKSSFSFGNENGCTSPGWGSFPLPADLVTDWTHGKPFYGLSVRAANESDTGAYKKFSSANISNVGKPYLDITYSPHGVAFHVEEVTLPTNTRDGTLKVTVKNRGSQTWTPTGPHKFGFFIKKSGSTVQTSPKFSMPSDVSPNESVPLSVPIKPLEPATYQVYLTMYNGTADYHPTYGSPYGVFDMKTVNVPPSVNYQQPGNGAEVDSRKPTLYAEAIDDDNWPGKGFRYSFKLCDDAAGTVNCYTSPWSGRRTWSPPAGRMAWSKSYYWWVRAHDTVNGGPLVGPLLIEPTVPQPEITAHLGGTPEGAPAPGLDPQVGNFGLATTDARVRTVGPDLSITRTYNSLDPRTDTAFGQGWASRLDTTLLDERVEGIDEAGNVLVTLPSGRQVRFGRNHDGSYAAPRGENLTLVYAASTGTYTMRDASKTRWVFNAWGRLKSVTDPDGLVQQLEYDPADPIKPVSVFNPTSQRRIHLTWTGGHVTQARTDPPASGQPALVWTYSYTGHALESVCDPGPAPNCTRYTHQPGSHYRSVVLDDNPRGYWRFGESTNTAPAASANARKPGADAGSYRGGVALGGQGALSGTADGAAAFNGADSYVTLPQKLTSPTMTVAVELWFKTTAGGVLMSYADQPFGSTTASKEWTPILYVGQDGHLRGGFWVEDPDGARQATSADPVDDGGWHHAVLTGSITTQTLYLDGVAQGTVKGAIDHDLLPHLTVGAGKTNNWPSGNEGNYHFAGHIDEVALYQHALSGFAVRQHFAAAKPVVQLTQVTTPQDNRVAIALGYDDINDRVATYTDRAGRAWRLDPPARNEAVRTVALHGPYPDWTYTYDADKGGRTTAVTHDGKTRTYGYNSKGFRSEETDELGHKATFTTDDRGNVLSRKTCRTGTTSCQTAYSTYFLNTADPLDPRNDQKLTESDPRSSGPTDVTYRTSYTYNTDGRLASATHPKPEGATAAPVESWRYATGTEPAVGVGTVPRGLLIEHTGKRPGQTSQYLYQANGDLDEEVGPTGLRTRYGYDNIGRRTSVATASASGQVFGTTTYTFTPRSQVDTETGPVTSNAVTGAQHRLVTRYTYDANGNPTQVVRSDTAGGPTRTTTHGYNALDQMVSTTYPDGGVETREYRSAGQEVRVTDPRGTTWIDHFDSRSRLTRRVASGPGVDPENPDSTALALEVRQYDVAGRLALVRDAMGRETTYTYFDDDRVATVTQGGVVQEQYGYDAAGNVTTLTRAGNRVTATTYDPAGHPKTVTVDPAGVKRVTAYARDADGLVRTESRTGAADPARTESVSYSYNAAGQLVREDVQPVAGTTLSTTYVLDERGLVLESANRRRMTTEFGYDGAGQLVRQTEAAVETWVGGQRTTGVRPETITGYNAHGDITHQRDPNGSLTQLGHDALGRVTSTQLPDYIPPGQSTPLRPVLRTGYDKVGNPISSTDGLGRVTSRGYDPYGRVTTETLPQVGTQPSTTSYGYDRNGELLSTTDPSGATSLSTYDVMGRKKTDTAVERQPQSYLTTTYGYSDAGDLVSVTSPAGGITETSYNGAGEPVTVKDPTGKVTSFGYDIAGRQASVTDPAGVVSRTAYDLIGRPTVTTQLAGSPLVEHRRWTQSYDPNGNLSSVLSPEGRLRSLAYDALDRLAWQDEKISGTKTVRTGFGYDATGNRTRLVDGRGHATNYTFTQWGLPESTIEAGATWTAVYDGAAQKVRESIPGGVAITSEYNPQGRVTVQRGTGAEAATVDKTFGYDPAGRLASFGTPGGTTTVAHNDRGLVTGITGPSGNASFSYDSDGRVASRTDASGAASFSYDAAGRPTAIVDGLSGRTIDHAYDAAGRLSYTAERGMASYVKRLRSYDSVGRLAGDKVTELDPGGGPSRTVLGVEYGYDRDDNITSRKSIANDATAQHGYGYDGASRLTSWTAPSGTVTPYEWDDAGNRTRAGSASYTYNERDQMVSGDGKTFTYTARGTLASDGSRTPKFDAFDRLVSDGVAYGYDSLDRVASRGGVGFSYGSLENDPVSDGRRLISRGLDGDPLSDQAIGSTDTAKLLYADQHGDILGRFRGPDSHGTRSYDPFGTVTGTSGEQPSLGYQGEWTEPTTGNVNMHSRWYTPSTGTFTSRDTWQIPPHPSVAANRYTYANANPTGYTDPSGHGPLLFCALYPPVCQTAATTAIGLGGAAWRGIQSLSGKIRDGLHSTAIAGAFVRDYFISLLLWHHRRAYPSLGPSYGRNDVPSCRTVNCYWPTGDGSGSNGHPGYGGPGYGGPGVPIFFPPPPPPLWWINLDKPAPRPKPGDTTKPRPPRVPVADERTKLKDLSDRYAEQANKLTEAVEDAGLNEDALERALDDAKDEAQDCFGSGNPPGQHQYWDLDDGRATGADTCLDDSVRLRSCDRTKSPYRPSVDVKGYEPGKHQKGHLIAAMFCGVGNDKRNLVPLTRAANVKGMYHDFERCVANQLKAKPKQEVFYVSVPIYGDESGVPEGVAMLAVGNEGYVRTKFIPNEKTYNPGKGGYCS